MDEMNFKMLHRRQQASRSMPNRYSQCYRQVAKQVTKAEDKNDEYC